MLAESTQLILSRERLKRKRTFLVKIFSLIIFLSSSYYLRKSAFHQGDFTIFLFELVCVILMQVFKFDKIIFGRARKWACFVLF